MQRHVYIKAEAGHSATSRETTFALCKIITYEKPSLSVVHMTKVRASPAALLLLLVVSCCSAAPTSTFSPNAQRRPSDFESVVTVDCTNAAAVNFVSQMHANFRCVYPKDSQRDDNALLFSNPSDGRSAFPSDLESGSLTREDPENCAPGTIFVPEIGICMQAHKPLRSSPLESDSLHVDKPIATVFTSNLQTRSDCTKNQIFNTELGICLDIASGGPVPPLSSASLVREESSAVHRPLEIQAFSSGQAASECREGEMFVPEIGVCVPVSSSSSRRLQKSPSEARPLQSANLIKETQPAAKFIDNDDTSDCEPGEIFVPEIGICMSVTPPKVRPPTPIISDSLVKDKDVPVPVASEPIKCPPGQILVSELGICLPANPPSKNQGPLQSSSLVKEPEFLEIQSFKDSKDHTDCAPGTFFVAEIGECL
ncbi:uncharacterized protein LOC108664393 [Hyalella azteca]|uniref:Uncharacterized protein LOC108664393 n=1 Tax=Hyalella azteca TaxID=294128 RepID=A0A8B7MZS8_HYAAZ|nr:uncharacterized protein LOC108664393 [Hyalella azteca]